MIDVYVTTRADQIDRAYSVAPGIRLDLNAAGRVIGVHVAKAIGVSVDPSEPDTEENS